MQGKDSIFDINSIKFDPTLLKKPQVKSESMDILKSKNPVLSVEKSNAKTCLQLIPKS